MGFFEIFAGALSGFYAVLPSLGLGIILLTIVVRLLLLPLSIKQTRSMKEMQAIQPEVAKIRSRYKIDRKKMSTEQIARNRQKMNEETMKLYKEHGVNPLGGCLPLLLQFPVLIALFYVVRAPLKYLGYVLPEGVEAGGVVPPQDYVIDKVSGFMDVLQNSGLANDLRGHALTVNQFLGFRLDCSPSAALSGEDPQKIGEICGSGIVAAIPYLILMLLMGATTYYQQRQMMAARGAPTDPQAQQQQAIMRFMPLMLMFFAFTFPAGAVLYWVVTNVWTIGQQRIMLGRFGAPAPAPAPAPAAQVSSAATTKPVAGKPVKKGTQKPQSDGAARQTARSGSAKKKKKR